MRFEPVGLGDLHVVELERHEDERGWFARAYCSEEFAEQGLSALSAQTNLSYSAQRGTLRGMHYQTAPAEEAKLVRCVAGTIYDVAVDVRAGSPTYLEWFGAELSRDNGRALHVPEGFAHGFLTLDDEVLVTYQVSEFYTPGAERGLRYDDPAVGIEWPLEPAVVSDKDRSWPLLDEAAPGAQGSDA